MGTLQTNTETKGSETKILTILRNYFSVNGQPVSIKEFREFWNSCTEEEKEEFRKFGKELPQ